VLLNEYDDDDDDRNPDIGPSLLEQFRFYAQPEIQSSVQLSKLCSVVFFLFSE